MKIAAQTMEHWAFRGFLALTALDAILAMVLNTMEHPPGSDAAGRAVVWLFLAALVCGLALGAWCAISNAIYFWKKPQPRTNGWQRLGIVASVLWILIAFTYVESQETWAWRDYRYCVERGTSEKDCYMWFSVDRQRAEAQQNYRAMVFAFVPPLLAWPFAWIVIGTVRWVVQGFRRRTAP
ncbi:MAG: hypothetical protein J2P50_14065 [Hyphomicrobiaceae bacterium]|nr:hypothetical protein [Hyphomicrobiaceae bacterium]